MDLCIPRVAVLTCFFHQQKGRDVHVRAVCIVDLFDQNARASDRVGVLSSDVISPVRSEHSPELRMHL